MKTELCNAILAELGNSFNGEQLKLIETAIYNSLYDYHLSKEEKETALTLDVSSDGKAYQMFFVAKKIEGFSVGSLKFYQYEIKKFFEFLHKPLNTITADDLRFYFATRGKITDTYLKNKRAVLASFFKWLTDEEYITKNPMAKIKVFKSKELVLLPFSNDEIEKLKDACKDKRERAIISLLLSTGMRCAELSNSNRSDVDFVANEIKVLGKGNKERICYLNAAAKKHLQDYLATRNDNYPALITNLLNNGSRTKDNRLRVSGIEILIRNLGRHAGVPNTHPHRFRRTAATMALLRGMPVEQVRIMLGHEKIDTTMRYARTADNTVKHSHAKFM